MPAKLLLRSCHLSMEPCNPKPEPRIPQTKQRVGQSVPNRHDPELQLTSANGRPRGSIWRSGLVRLLLSHHLCQPFCAHRLALRASLTLAARLALCLALDTCPWQPRRETDRRSQFSQRQEALAHRESETGGVSDAHLHEHGTHRARRRRLARGRDSQLVKERFGLSPHHTKRSRKPLYSDALVATIVRESGLLPAGCQLPLDQDRNGAIHATMMILLRLSSVPLRLSLMVAAHTD